MARVNVFFCCKTFLYYADMYRSMLARAFSIANRGVTELVRLSKREPNMTLEEKEKMALVVDGLLNMAGFVGKVCFDKIIEVVELKTAHEAMDLGDFKQLANVYETEEDFISKYLIRML